MRMCVKQSRLSGEFHITGSSEKIRDGQIFMQIGNPDGL